LGPLGAGLATGLGPSGLNLGGGIGFDNYYYYGQ
jgi:hypothetical protein